MAFLRVFVAANPDAEAHEAIVAFRDAIRGALPQNGCRWAKDDQLHLTLRFVGELPEERLAELESKIASTCGTSSALTLSAAFEGAPWKDARVIALAIKSAADALQDLQQRIEADVHSLGIAPESRVFHPHLTLARIDHPNLQPRLPERVIAEWPATELLLVQSELGMRGATHRELARFPLQ
jgi:RNA 2',3'-cyclic 3'-phosphodiesterase